MSRELVGEEKRIQGLFSELRFADEQTNPSFAVVWNCAQSKTVRRRRAFNPAFVAAAALLVCALISLGWWSKRWQQNPEVTATAPARLATGLVKVKIENEELNVPKALPKGASSDARSRPLKLAARRAVLLLAANRKARLEAKALASWQSPTAALLASPSDDLFKSLPQLNQTVDELKSFLPTQPK